MEGWAKRRTVIASGRHGGSPACATRVAPGRPFRHGERRLTGYRSMHARDATI
ncbi:hypothetical protein BURCENBC7_AP7937 [Burkholderia cenocepacia BC7]|nr:hypothetical protein BURCENK562V_C6837 [Burkholderia cenocepacia K56-2Valvano]ERI29322.1 hypothetical protein BURCENBC7_AP7937 [Burkholderia cenocepacia BC7]